MSRAQKDMQRAQRQAAARAKKEARKIQKDAQRAQRQAAAKAEKNIRAARRAALQAKNQVERAAKQVADTGTCLFANNKEARGLKVGGTVTVRIFAKKMCNDTKIMVLTGHKYSFEANGKWTDLDNTCDADGYPSPNTLLRASEGLRRMPGANWFALICAVNADKKLLFPIGTRRTMSMPRSGRLACFANDVATMYGNNKGEVKLTVTRVD
jgi:hypothetical protein